MKNMGLKNFDNSNKINLHTFAVIFNIQTVPILEGCFYAEWVTAA